jgi:hypothetical protein
MNRDLPAPASGNARRGRDRGLARDPALWAWLLVALLALLPLKVAFATVVVPATPSPDGVTTALAGKAG